MAMRIILGLGFAALLIGALLANRWSPADDHVSGFVEADEIRLGSRVGGRVLSVHVQEGQPVSKGAALLQLEPYDLTERRAQAAAQLAGAKARLDLLRSGFRSEEIAQAKARRDRLAASLAALQAGPRPQEIEAGKARLDAATAQLALARANYDRIRRMFASKATSRDELDRADDELQTALANSRVRSEELALLREGARREDIDGARAELEESQQALALLEAGYRSQELAQAQAELAAMSAALAAVERQLAELVVRAPVAGVVEALDLRPGDLIAASAPVVSMLDLSNLWVRAYVPENRLDVKLKQQVRVTVDSYPQRSFKGHIAFIARQAEFTPSNVQTPEDRSKRVFRIKVSMDDGHELLRPGMAADVWLDEAP